MKKDAIYCVPLGGCGIFGANMTLYGYNGQWIMVDCGMGFADDTLPGVDILLPDPSFVVELGDKLLAVVLTHGHEDHIGALSYLWPRFQVPLYATGFTATRIQQSLSEQAWGNQVDVHIVPEAGAIDLGPFHINYIRMAHSIPEGNALAIAVKDVGCVLHTGDWKLDADPVQGYHTDEKALRALGDGGVLAVMGDSTNAMVPGHSGSEGEVKENLAEVIGQFKNRVFISCFSTNVARLYSIALAAQLHGRSACLVGRSLWSVVDAAKQNGYLKDCPPFINVEDAEVLAPENVLYICTGSQGEPRAALPRIAAGDYRGVHIGEGDVVIFSSRAIPGNMQAINRMKNRIYASGADILTGHEAPVHVSGHPYREELKTFYSWVRPHIAIPVHGEWMQQEKHADLAKECGIPHTHIPQNGEVIELTQDEARVVDDVSHGILAIEGGRIVAMDHNAILTRKRIMYNGSAVVTVVVDHAGDLVADPKMTALGLLDEDCDVDLEIIHEAEDVVAEAVRSLPKGLKQDHDAFSEEIRIQTRRFFAKRFGRKPQTRVHLVRV